MLCSLKQHAIERWQRVERTWHKRTIFSHTSEQPHEQEKENVDEVN